MYIYMYIYVQVMQKFMLKYILYSILRLNRAVGSRCLIRAMLKIKHQSSITDFSVAICLLSFLSFQRKIAIQIQVAILNLLTGKSLSEELIFASSNPQYDKRFFIELQVQYIKTK